MVLTWDAPAAAAASVTGYQVLWRLPGDNVEGGFRVLAATDAIVRTYTDEDVGFDDRIIYQVKALYGEALSRGSGEVLVYVPPPRPEGLLASGSTYGTVRLWDVASRQHLATLDAGDRNVRDVAFSPDGGVLAAASDFRIDLWDTASFMSPRSRVPDFDGDGAVGFSDFVKFTAKFGFSRGQVGYDPRYDLDRDGEVGYSDFLIFAEAFGKGTSST